MKNDKVNKDNQDKRKTEQYDHSKIEKKWQKEWAKTGMYKASDKDAIKNPENKFFTLVEFPFPSGAGLHTGHTRSYTAMDIVSRKKRAEGKNVLFPIGWDAFGLPTENYAIKTGIDPQKATKQNTDTFRRQLKSVGISFDWSREVNTTDPAYYKWTQWIFLQMFKKGLAYKDKITINWCPKDKIGLANEEVVNGCCERCGTQVEKRDKEQWMLAITKYADRLDKDLDNVNYLEKIKIQQRNWIGKSIGSEIDFKIENSDLSIKAFTTRADTLFGVTYVVLAPESQLVKSLWDNIKNKEEVQSYIDQAKAKDDMDRTAEGKEKTGVKLDGVFAINPANGEKVSVWIADYVLATYGTGAVMAVPAHDERDFQLAKKYGLEIKNVIMPKRIDNRNPHVKGKEIVKREGVIAIVFNPATKKYLGLNWKTQNWTTFITGGVDTGEDPIDAAKREITEETGYRNLKFIKTLGDKVRTEFYAAHKDVNRVGLTSYAVFEIENEDKTEVEQSEKDLHEVVWLSEDDIKSSKMSHSEMDIILDRLKNGESAVTEQGILTNSGKFNDMDSETAKKEITKSVGGKIVTKYKLRDWVFSRQRYWGEPIPMINCPDCGWVPVPEKDLPVKLPKVAKYEPTDDGESPLSKVDKWVNTKCPVCKSKAKRETDTMPNWAGSSWYYLRYADNKNDKQLASPEKLKAWNPVDWYNGGMEHTTLHLLYSRFWHKFLFDIGVVDQPEPYMKRTSQGMILAEGGVKMSKSLGNVVNPDDVIKAYGADTLRVYQMFMGPFDQPVAWDTSSIIGSRRFVERAFNLFNKIDLKSGKKSTKTSNPNTKPDSAGDKELESLIHKTIKKVGDDIESMSFNTAISTMMILLNAFEKAPTVACADYEIFIKLLAPFAPHISDELWAKLGHKKSVHLESWPKYDPIKLDSGVYKIVVQINNKVRAVFETTDMTDEEIKAKALSLPEIVTKLEGATPKSVIYVKGRLINIIV
jgi:leucyl-tRNA synthetase